MSTAAARPVKPRPYIVLDRNGKEIATYGQHAAAAKYAAKTPGATIVHQDHNGRRTPAPWFS